MINEKEKEQERDIFERLRNGEKIPSGEHKLHDEITEACYTTRRLLLKMNSASNSAKIRYFLHQIIAAEVDEVLLYLHHCTLIVAKILNLAKIYL